MTQERYWDYRGPLSQSRMIDVYVDIIPSGVYTGCGVTWVSGDILQLSAGRYVMPHGMVVKETTARQLTVPRTSALAQYFTLVAVHDFQTTIRTNRVDYVFLTGRLTRDQVQTIYASTTQVALLLAWVHYNGSTYDTISLPAKVALAAELLYKMQYFEAPFYHVKQDPTTSILSTIIDNTYGPCFKLTGNGYYEFLIGFHDLQYVPYQLTTKIYATAGSSVQFTINPHAAGVASTYSTSLIFDTEGWQDLTWSIPEVSQRLHCALDVVMRSVAGPLAPSPYILLPYLAMELKNVAL